MSAPEWVAALGDRDPSVAIALAAITRAAGPNDVAGFGDLVMSYREAHLACYQGTANPPAQEISGDAVRDHLRNSVLPRLSVEGWLLDTSASDWEPVQPRVAWWGVGGEDRQAIYGALLAAARRAAQRSKPQAPQRASTSVLEGTRLVKTFKDRRVVNEVSVKVEQGEIVGLLGPNGAGKTTTFYLITGLIRPDSGQVKLDGLDLTRSPMYERARSGIGYLAQEPSIFRKMTVEENILAILETRPAGTGRASAPAGPHARRAVHQAPAAEPGVQPERRRAPSARDHQGPRHRARSSCCSTSPSRASIRSRCTTSRPSSPDSAIGASAS